VSELVSPDLRAVFEKRSFQSDTGPTDWTTEPVPFYIYEKLAHKWICSLCSAENELVELATCARDHCDARDCATCSSGMLVPLEQCSACREDPNGMRRSNYSTRRAKKA
jgi:hypothetical protein